MKLNNKGFSLVELMIEVMVSVFFFGGITALMAFTSRSMRDTNNRVEIQNEAKDSMNHIESYIMESQQAVWDETSDALFLFYDKKETLKQEIIKKDEDGTYQLEDSKVSEIASLKNEVYVYWVKDGCVYFAQCNDITPSDTDKLDASSIISGGTISNEKNHLLAENVTDFSAEVLKNSASDKQIVDLNLNLKNDSMEYKNQKYVYIRNQ